METRYGIVILAAGGSSRLGEPKQLLTFNEKSLLGNVVAAAKIPGVGISVVTGAGHNLVESELKNENVSFSYNADWPSGMASSIRQGIREIRRQYGDLKAIIIAVCDQPYVSTRIFEELISTYEKNRKGIVASAYADTIGTPALFTKRYFDNLERLRGDEGAKKIIKQFSSDVEPVVFEKGNIDIDTAEDYRRLVDTSNKSV